MVWNDETRLNRIEKVEDLSTLTQLSTSFADLKTFAALNIQVKGSHWLKA